MIETRNFNVPYPRDNSLNIFGDYKSLHCNLSRDSETPEKVKEEWTLVGLAVAGGASPRVLNEAEVTEALRTLFFYEAAL